MLIALLMSGMGSASAAALGGKIVFGRVSKDCTGFGICYMNIEVFGFTFEYGTRGGTTNAVAIETSVDETKNTFTLTFSVRELSQKDSRKAAELDRERFVLDEDITLSKDANKAYELRRTTPITLKAGSYAIQKNGDTAKVVIDIR